MKVAAILGPKVRGGTVERFAAPGVELETIAGFQALPAESWQAVLVFGGDGTVHLHLREVHERRIPMLVVPVGSGNDFANALGIGSVREAEEAWREFCAGRGNVREIDLGEIKSSSPQRKQGKANADPSAPLRSARDDNSNSTRHDNSLATLFCCIGGAGLDAETNRRANRMARWMRGHGGYVLAAVAEIAHWRAVEMKVEVSSGHRVIGSTVDHVKAVERPKSSIAEDTEDAEELHGRATLVAFANASTYGHGMKMAPRARLDDGKLDICFVREASKRRLLTFFPTVFSGKHVDMPEVEYRQAEWLRLETGPPLAVYADGEYVCDTPVEVRVVPRALRCIVKPKT